MKRPKTMTSLAVVCAWFAVGPIGCILSPPIEPPDKQNTAPYIDPSSTNPPQHTMRVTRELVGADDRIRFSVRVFDAERENQLYYAWLSDKRGALTNENTLNPTSAKRVDGKPGYAFEDPSSIQINPCEAVSPSNGLTQTETIFFVVSDRSFTNLSSDIDQIEVVSGGLIDIRSWNLEYAPDLCN